MKLPLRLALALLACGGRAYSQGVGVPPVIPSPTPITLDGSLMLCGQENVVLVEGSVSSDARYAFAWTLHPSSPAQKPVEWSYYRPGEAAALLKKFPISTEEAPNGYLVINGVVDFKARLFIPLPFVDPANDPFYTGKHQASLQAAWSEGKDDCVANRHAIICNNRFGDGSERTLELWLYQAGHKGGAVANLKTPADVVVQSFLSRFDNQRQEKYKWYFSVGEDADVFTKGKTAKLRFDAAIPLDPDPKHRVTGYMMFELPSGKVHSVTRAK